MPQWRCEKRSVRYRENLRRSVGFEAGGREIGSVWREGKSPRIREKVEENVGFMLQYLVGTSLELLFREKHRIKLPISQLPWIFC